jgi:hypothetical protein
MTDAKFEARVKATGLRPKPDDMAMLEALVKDLDRAALMLRGPRSFAEEPLNAFSGSSAVVCGGAAECVPAEAGVSNSRRFGAQGIGTANERG